MTAAKLRDLGTLDDVAETFGVQRAFIEEYAGSADQKSYYKVLKIPKKNPQRRTQCRVVFRALDDRLLSLHRSLSMVVVNSCQFGNHVQGFVKRRSTRSNAAQHLGAKILLHADIKGFFDHISVESVRNALVAQGTTPKLAVTLAHAGTISGLLRQGTRCSPALANLACLDMDQALLRLASNSDCVYTRYADDIVFSGDAVPTDESIRAVLDSYGFQLRDGRCYRQYRGRSQYVTGLTISDEESPRLPKRLKRRLRLIMHYIGKYGIAEGMRDPKQSIGWLSGMLRYAASVEPDLVAPWLETLRAADAVDDQDIEQHEYDDRPRDIYD